MHIFDFKQNYWLAFFYPIDYKELYVDTYNENFKIDNYYSNDIIQIRNEIINKYADISHCFDFGCGRKPSYDTNKILGLYDPYVYEFSEFNRLAYQEADTLLLFDVIEHMFNPSNFLLTLKQNRIIMTVPIFPRNLKTIDDLYGWKHFKPGEHIYNFTLLGILELLKQTGFASILYCDSIECAPRGPREDVYTIVAERKI